MLVQINIKKKHIPDIKKKYIITSTLAPSSVPIVRAPFNINFILPVPLASVPAVLIYNLVHNRIIADVLIKYIFSTILNMLLI